MVLSDNCQTNSLKPTWVTISFAGLSIIMVIITIIFSMKHLKRKPSSLSLSTQTNNQKINKSKPSQESQTKSDRSNVLEIKADEEKKEAQLQDNINTLETNKTDVGEEKEEKKIGKTSTQICIELEAKSEWDKADGFCAKFKLCVTDIWGRKSVYLPLISHLSDTATDFASVVEFGIVAANSDPKTCGINVWYLFALSIGCMLTYRIISSYKIYEITGSWCRVFVQFLDIELFHILYLSHFMGLQGTSSPQRLLSVLEAVFEAAPQSVIQLVYIMFTRNMSTVVIASAVFSFFNLTLSIIGDDAKMLRITFVKPGKEGFMKFLFLYLYRIMDIPSKILSFVFLWYFVGGAVCFVFLGVDCLIAIGLYWKTKNTDALLSMVAVPLSFGSDDFHVLLYVFWCWCIIETLAINILIWSWSMTQRNIFETEPSFIVGLWLFCSLGLVVKWCLGWVLIFFVRVDMKSSKERANLNSLLLQKKYEDAMELIIFKDSNISSAASKLYGDGQHTLLTIAMKCNNKRIFDVVLNEGFDNNERLDIEFQEIKYKTALCVAVVDKKMEYIQKITNTPGINVEYINNGTRDGETALYLAIEGEDVEMVKCFIECVDKVLKNSVDAETKWAHILNNVNIEWKRTALHVACEYRVSIEIFQMLYNCYGSTSVAKEALAKRDWDGKTALEYCRMKQNQELETFIVNKLKN